MSEAKIPMISTNPHIRSKENTSSIMREVCFALIPVMVYSILFFGFKALLLEGIAVITAVLSELIWQLLTKQRVTIWDFSAVLTGLLLAFNLPISAPWWIPMIGSAFAIIIVKQLFGGIGQNFMNPALAARCFLLLSWTSIMTNFQTDANTSATPLTALAEGSEKLPSVMGCFLGQVNGCIGEVSSMLILLGGIYLIIRKIVDFRIPLAYLATVYIMSLIFKMDGLYQLFSGGLMLGAFFMATDYVTSPMNRPGKWIFGFGCGLLTFLIRRFGGYPEGVSFSILFMNVCTPLIDRFTKPRIYGMKKDKEEVKA